MPLSLRLPSRRGWRAMVLGLLLASLAACAGAGRMGDGIPSPADRDDIHRRFVAAAGGAYPDARLQDYVASVGRRLAAKSEAPASTWRFTVLDHESPNGLATPSGRWAIRGRAR